MWKHFRWNADLFDKKALLGVTPSEADVNNIVYSIHKRHHRHTSMDMMIEIQSEAYRDDSCKSSRCIYFLLDDTTLS